MINEEKPNANHLPNFHEIFWPTGEFDDDGVEIMGMTADGAVLVLIDSVFTHHHQNDQCKRAVALFNKWVALLRQNGFPAFTIEKFKKATRRKTPASLLIKDIAAANERVNFLSEVFNVGL